MMMLLDLLYPALWVVIAAVGLGFASRGWVRKTSQAFARAQAEDERRAEHLQSQLTQVANLLTARLEQAQVSTSKSEAQLRSQLALKWSELEASSAEQTRILQAQIEQNMERQFAQVRQTESEREGLLRSESAQRQTQLENLVMDRMTHLEQLMAAQDHGSDGVTRAGAGDSIDCRRRMDRLQNDLDFVKNHMSSYLGSGTGLTHLVDETPIYINTNDFGCPSNFINGGRYEEEYYQVLASFRRPDSVMLDIGANLGVFSLRLAPLMRHGKVYAFEPNSEIHELFTRSIHLNGLKALIEVFKLGVSDQNAELTLNVPQGHAGGASVQPLGETCAGPRISVRRIDDMLAGLPHFDLAKIDVEGHELNALRGMAGLLGRSEHAVILFEKLGAHSGIEGPLVEFFASFAMDIHRIDGVTLVKVDEAQFSASEAYFLAARASTIGGVMVRNFINLLPGDLFSLACQVNDGALSVQAQLPPDTLIFHGPYWYLPRGSYILSVAGQVHAGFKLVVAEKFGFPVAEFLVRQDRLSFDFIVENDLTHFEVVARAGEGPVGFLIEGIRLTRLG